jgi:ankyrin repeat protein
VFDPLAIHDAFLKGNLDQLKSLLGEPDDFPDTRLKGGLDGTCLEYAIYHSPLSLIQALLDLGADPNYQDDAGFPSLIATLSSERPDKRQIIDLLLSFGATLEQRGINGWTPLHYAAANNDALAVAHLLAHGADPAARTVVDDYNTPLGEAEQLGSWDAVRVLRQLGGKER